ncbi:hypothetical protein K1719_012118 [Acacia pycnantha]|nr:hypothetical protein K1719_012118 [Acacia pycnantha]
MLTQAISYRVVGNISESSFIDTASFMDTSIDANGDDNLISFGFYVSMALGFIDIYVQVAIQKAKIKRRFQN